MRSQCGYLLFVLSTLSCGRFGYEDGSSSLAEPDAGGDDSRAGDAGVPEAAGPTPDAPISGDALRAGPPPRPGVATGSYVGDGHSGRAVTSLGFRPTVVWVKGDNAGPTVMRTATMSSDRARDLGNGAAVLAANLVIDFLSEGMVVGDASAVNETGSAYHFLALPEAPGFSAVGRFTTGGSARYTVAGIGLSPGYVFIACDGHPVVHRSRLMPISRSADGQPPWASIVSFDADGFTFVSSSTSGGSLSACHWFAAREHAEHAALGVYTGDAGMGRAVTNVGFSPEALVVQCEGMPLFWTARGQTNRSFRFSAETPGQGLIVGLTPDGFTLGAAAEVNGAGRSCAFLAWRAR